MTSYIKATPLTFLVKQHSNFKRQKARVRSGKMRCIYALSSKRGVKMAGYWPSFSLAFLCTETNSRSILGKGKALESKQVFVHYALTMDLRPRFTYE